MVTHKELAEYCLQSYIDVSITKNDVEILLVEKESHIIVAFRGTETSNMWSDGGFIDVLRDLRFWPSGYHGLRGHAGFLKGVRAIEKELLHALKHLPPKPVILTGHSLGGGLAIPCVPMLLANSIEVVSLVTFGCPRCISKGFEKFKGITVHQYEYGDDVVPTYQWWTPRKHLNRIPIGKPRSEQWFKNRTWDDHAIELYIKAF